MVRIPILGEVWKPVSSFAGYEVSNRGRVRSFKKKAGPGAGWIIAREPQRFLKQGEKGPGGYCYVNMSQNGILYNRAVAHLVLEAFVGPRPDGMEACHNDCDKGNNRLENLRYDTHRNNVRDGPGKLAQKRLTNAKVLRLRQLAAQGTSDEELCAEFGLGMSAIYYCRTGRRHSYVGGPITTYPYRGRHPLTDAKVQELRELVCEGSLEYKDIAATFGISVPGVSRLARGERRRKAGGPISPGRRVGA